MNVAEVFFISTRLAAAKRIGCLSFEISSFLRNNKQGVVVRTNTTKRMFSISRMLDLGGMAPSPGSKKTIRPVDVSKKSKVQAVAFDFELLVAAIKDQNIGMSSTPTTSSAGNSSGSTIIAKSSVQPDVKAVEAVADLLQVDLEGNNKSKHTANAAQDDLSLLLSKEEEEEIMKTKRKAETKAENDKKNSGSSIAPDDVRNKYISKLRKKGLHGGLSSVDRAKHEIESSLHRGDAEGHLSARQIVMKSPSSSPKRWMAQTGIGKLLANLSHRAIKIALLPNAVSGSSSATKRDNDPSMTDFQTQMKDVTFDLLIQNTKGDHKSLIGYVAQELEVAPQVIMVVSDQDKYLKYAKENGMITCRIQKLNARRGNISAHHTVDNILKVQDVINEMNGISLVALFNKL